jgi:hypothetical protein
MEIFLKYYPGAKSLFDLMERFNLDQGSNLNMFKLKSDPNMFGVLSKIQDTIGQMLQGKLAIVSKTS